MPPSHHLLRRAAEAGDVDAVERRLVAGDPLEGRHKGTGRTPLLDAVIAGHLDVVRLLLERGADPTVACTAMGATALGWSAIQGQPAIAALLLERGSDPNLVPASNALGRTATLLAAQAGDVEVLALLLGAGGDPSLVDHRGDNALALAAAAGRTEAVDLLVAAGATMPEPPPAGPVLPWPEVPASLGGATPVQVVRSYIVSIHTWEVDAWRALQEARAAGQEAPFGPLMEQAHAIRAAHCTTKKRAYARAGVSGIPQLTPAMVLVEESAPTASRRELLVRHGEDETVVLDNEWRFVCRREGGHWRLDSASRRVRGTIAWHSVIL